MPAQLHVVFGVSNLGSTSDTSTHGFLSMIRKLQLTKVHHPVELTYDGDGLRIEGDFNAAKRGKPSYTCFCIPLPPPKRADPLLLPIQNTNILRVCYNERLKMVEIHALIPMQHDKEDSLLELYKFMYSLSDNNEEEAKQFCKDLMHDVYKDMKPEKRLKVIVNPAGGQGKAKDIFEFGVKPVFEAANCEMDIQYTEHQGHALQIAKDLDINRYDAIVTVSGDGIIHEVINGFLQRPDARQAIKNVPLGLIPGGTSNSLSICLLDYVRGYDPVYSALQVIKGQNLALDLCSVTYADHRYFSFLSQNHGITAYADLATEHLRWMGDTRNIIGLMQQIFARQSYPVEVALQIEESNKERIKSKYRDALVHPVRPPLNELDGPVVDTIPPLSEPVPEDWTVINDDLVFFLTSKVPSVARDMLTHPCALPNDGLIDALFVRGHPSIAKQMEIFKKIEHGQHIDSPLVEYYKVKAFRFTPKAPAGKKAYTVIDGENAPNQPFQVQVHSRLGCVLSLYPTFKNSNI
ncbi:ATP-NAD kinase-like domain-containing protein [Radiomyces spectabilis]|uniref:ATP-NAD kinase-like domain-containing protein n=1 Tax=Radiomyces spectabilis TaxID=64574 RepID=UPI00221F8E0C|nr:ATP-NAD kinase-like domain-containing protein [Radiomyces spectabilis]KAI8388563.1 ATP-NAD kinase-like domain-containing protein [Radiomyces spectabilis]